MSSPPEWNPLFRSLDLFLQYSYYYMYLLITGEPNTPHRNNGTTHPTCGRFIAIYVQSLYSSTNQQCFKKNFHNQSSHYGNYRRFPLGIETIMCLPQN